MGQVCKIALLDNPSVLGGRIQALLLMNEGKAFSLYRDGDFVIIEE